jgi:hypothetical protein
MVTGQLIFSEVNRTVAARTKFLFKEVAILDVSLSGLNEPRLVHLDWISLSGI